MRLQDKIAIIAGGAQGIGEGIVRCLAAEGADIAVVDINCDAAGRIDILVNNVGGVSAEMSQRIEEHAASFQEIAGMPTYMRFNPDIWDRYYQLNLKSHVMLSNAVTPYFIKQKSGKIVNISSVSGRLADPDHMPYSAMKAGDISLTWSLARGLAPYNINVNCVCPGYIYTPLWERGANNSLKEVRGIVQIFRDKGEQLPRPLARFTDVDLESMTPREFWLKFIVRSSNPMGREQTPEDIGRAVVFFVSDDARNVTGQVLNVDGGQIMR